MAANDKKPINNDVAKPGKTPADATSRPVIVSRGPIMKDPMVSEPAAEIEESSSSALSASAKKVIDPPEDQKAKDETTDKPADTPEPKADSAKPEKSAEDSTSADDSTADSAVVDAVLDQVGSNKEQTEADKEAEARQELVNKLTADKKYFVPLAAAQHRRNNRVAIIVLAALIPLLIGIVLAIDAGVIDVGLQLPFDLIK